MKTMKILRLLLLISIFVSCTKKDEEIKIDENDYLIFGHFYGECIGEGCVETFKLTNEKLYEELSDNYPWQPSSDFTELGNDKFNAVKDLPDFFPQQLLVDTNAYFGCPDCADQGGLFIEYKNGEEIKNWRIDQSKSQVPEYLHTFMDKVNEKISLINN